MPGKQVNLTGCISDDELFPLGVIKNRSDAGAVQSCKVRLHLLAEFVDAVQVSVRQGIYFVCGHRYLGHIVVCEMRYPLSPGRCQAKGTNQNNYVSNGFNHVLPSQVLAARASGD